MRSLWHRHEGARLLSLLHQPAHAQFRSIRRSWHRHVWLSVLHQPTPTSVHSITSSRPGLLPLNQFHRFVSHSAPPADKAPHEKSPHEKYVWVGHDNKTDSTTPKEEKKEEKKSYWIPVGLVALGVATLFVVVATDDSDRHLYLLGQAMHICTRAVRDAMTALHMINLYNSRLDGVEEGPERDAIMHQVHKEGADMLRDLCLTNGGFYIKLGQHVAQMQYLLPDEYVLRAF
jgi:hypothetical protein